jgi:N-acetylglucosamine kinase-like BadF-type ATPase
MHSSQRHSASAAIRASKSLILSSMRCVLGFDGGGTKTDCVLMDESRQILARTRSGPSNPTRVGLEPAFAALLEAAEKALAVSGMSASDVVSIGGGIAGLRVAGVTTELTRMLRTKLPNANIFLHSDLSMALAATQEHPSIAVIAGTGSSVIGRNSRDHVARAGGLGPVLGDPGSAYDIGRQAIVLILRHDQRQQKSALARAISEFFGCDLMALQAQVRAHPERLLPQVFPMVTKTANEGDETSRKLLDSAAVELSELVADVVEDLELQNEPFFLAKTGGVFGRSAFFDDPFDARVTRIAPAARIGPLPQSIAEFAARREVHCLDSTAPRSLE